MKSRNLILMIVLMMSVALIAACSSPTPAAPAQVTITKPTQPAASSAASMANPASVFCGQNGGTTDIRKTATGEVGYCVFADKSECEEFAFMRGECKPGAKPTVAPAASSSAAATSFTDPFAYCTAVGNLDTIDARWTGAKMPDAVLIGLGQAAGVSPAMPKEVLAQQSFWRCMNNKVYACMVGANLPCQEKADTNKTPAAALNDFCKANPNAASIPAVVTGRATVYDWKCVGAVPTINKQVFTPDARGFISDFWYEIKPTTAAPGSTIANPASTFCVQSGGKSDIRKTAAGEVGYCVFPDKSECEEWAYMRGECKAGAKPSGATTNVTIADNGKTVQAIVGGTIVVTLEGNPGSTGYMWGLESGNDAVLKPAGDYKFTSTSNLPGASGKFTFTFTAASAGTATLKFANKRSWELNDPQAQTFSVTVTVK